MSLIFLLALAQAAPTPTPAGTDIVVRARRSAEALERCIATRCPTPDEARFAIAHAEAQFAQGQYHDARRTLQAALSRQKGNAKRFPRVVSALYEAAATVNLHMGDMDAYRTMTIGQGKALENLPPDDKQRLLMQLRLGDFWIKQGDPFVARSQYADAAQGFAARGEHQLAALSTLRVAMVALAMRDTKETEQRLDEVAASPAASDTSVMQVASVVRARLATYRGDEKGVDHLLATLRTQPDLPPLLVKDAPVVSAANLAIMHADKFGDVPVPTWKTSSPRIRWVDVGFMVAPDGTVAEAEVLRGSGSQEWANPYVAAIERRRYAPIALPEGSPGLYRVERITLRPRRVVPAGSLVKQPVGRESVEVLDITRDPAAAATGA
ncbi:hypothetical protein COC42_14340 [Sphingomonas spermidinifaciens]|uniref:TonB C-terminal domain-containing protein n=1 Tax=Sphingomonas spermidinifaciens TaxID=1141889 RepID=A0A2A4B469_9SPHN|nr:hypothetical protein [Sphingomonas spermidinifaciens]PCD02579.1 hypothetical protein COC42_14340 [Sphingomonas spermidinifaciens]